MQIVQEEVTLRPVPRGFHLITSEVEKIIRSSGINTGICQVFIKHTSASLSINENADPTVRADFESYFNRLAPEDEPYFLHNYEGSDDMPAHLKASLLGSSVTFPIADGRANLGTWQGVYLCEHCNHGGSRKVVITLFGH